MAYITIYMFSLKWKASSVFRLRKNFVQLRNIFLQFMKNFLLQKEGDWKDA